MYVRIFILRICARRRRCLNEAFLVKIANNNFMPSLRGFRWYLYFVAQEQLVSGIRGKQMTPAVASERSIFSKNPDYNSYIKSFLCRGEHVCTYVPGCRCTRWQKTTNRHTRARAGQPQ